MIFSLHVSFAKPVREITSAPFEVSEVGWGEFESTIRIYFKENQYIDTVKSLEVDMIDALTKLDERGIDREIDKEIKDNKKSTKNKDKGNKLQVDGNSNMNSSGSSGSSSGSEPSSNNSDYTNTPIELTHMIRLYHTAPNDTNATTNITTTNTTGSSGSNGSGSTSDGIPIAHEIDPILAKKVSFTCNYVLNILNSLNTI